MTHDILLVAVAAGVTMATRFLPFLIFRKQVPQAVRRLGAVLPVKDRREVRVCEARRRWSGPWMSTPTWCGGCAWSG